MICKKHVSMMLRSWKRHHCSSRAEKGLPAFSVSVSFATVRTASYVYPMTGQWKSKSRDRSSESHGKCHLDWSKRHEPQTVVAERRKCENYKLPTPLPCMPKKAMLSQKRQRQDIRQKVHDAQTKPWKKKQAMHPFHPPNSKGQNKNAIG